MFVILLTYKKPIEDVERHLVEHRKFLELGYKNNYFVVSGAKNPRTGGVIISQLDNRNQLEDLLKDDPFFINAIAHYEVIEFTPTKYHEKFSDFITRNNC